jgi:hypothetical protein
MLPGRSASYADIGLIDENFDELEYVQVQKFNRLRGIG